MQTEYRLKPTLFRLWGYVRLQWNWYRRYKNSGLRLVAFSIKLEIKGKIRVSVNFITILFLKSVSLQKCELKPTVWYTGANSLSQSLTW